MFLGIDWGPWLDPLFIGSTILTIAAGVLGFAQEHRTPEGKLTPAGKALAVVLIVAGLLSLALGLADRKIADEKERVADQEGRRQFSSQMAELRRVTGSLSRLQTDMSGSLRSQRELFGVADKNLRLSATLQEQERENTDSVLRRLFQESNRIAAERIAVSVSYRCPPLAPYVSGPEIRDVTLVVKGPTRNPITLTTNQKLNVGDGIMFHGFLGDLGPYETFPAWAAARVTIRLDGVPPAGRILAMDELLRMTDEEKESWAHVDRSISCLATVTLLLNGRQVLTGRAPLTRITEYEFDALFEGMRVDSNRLPHFAN